MSTSYVLDASCLAKSFLEERRSKEFRAWMSQVLERGDEILAPHIAYSEVGRIIQKECRDLRPSAAQELHHATFMGVELLPVNQSGAVWDHGAGLSYYDAEYIAAAVVHNSQLVSADDKQLKHAASVGIKVMSFSPGAA